MTSEENADIDDFDTTTTIPQYEDQSDSDEYFSDDQGSPDQQEIQVGRVLRPRRVDREEDTATATTTISTELHAKSPQQAVNSSSKHRSRSPRKRPRRNDSSSDTELQLDTTNAPEEQITNASTLDIQDTSSPTESPRLDRVPTLKPNDLLTTNDAVDALQKGSDATELQTTTVIPTSLLTELVKKLEQAHQRIGDLEQNLEEFRQNDEARETQRTDNARRLKELEQRHEALVNQRNEEKRELRALADKYRHLQQDVDQINVTENSATQFLTELVDKLYETDPDLAGPIVKATQRASQQADATSQTAKQQEAKAKHQTRQILKENVRLQRDKLQVEKELSWANHLSQINASGQQQGLNKSTHAPRGVVPKPAIKKKEPTVTTIIVKPFDEIRALRPSDLSKKLLPLIKAPTRLDRANYSLQGNLKVRVTCPTATTEQELSAIGDIIRIDRYHKLVVDGIPSADMLNEDGSLADAEHMKNAIEAQNDITLAQAPRALIPRKKKSEPSQFFTIAIYLKDAQDYNKLMETRKVKTPYAVGRVRKWTPKPSTYTPQPTSNNNLYKPRCLNGFQNDQQTSNSSESTTAVNEEPASTDADMPDAVPETSPEHHA